MKKFVPFIFVIALLVVGLGCNATSGIFPSPTPPPTQTPYPTFTPLPTFTAVPTNTPVPTPTKVIIPGIDTFVAIGDVDFKFFSGMLSSDPVAIGDQTLTPNPGYSVLVLKGFYKGDLLTLFNGDLQSSDGLYVDDGSGEIKSWVQLYSTDSEVTIGFWVETGASKYILHNTVGTPWKIDLGHFLAP